MTQIRTEAAARGRGVDRGRHTSATIGASAGADRIHRADLRAGLALHRSRSGLSDRQAPFDRADDADLVARLLPRRGLRRAGLRRCGENAGRAPLSIEKTDKNRWRLDTGGAATAHVSYRVFCNQRSVTTNEVNASVRRPQRRADVHDPRGARAAPARRSHRVAAGMDARDDRPRRRARRQTESASAPLTSRRSSTRRFSSAAWASTSSSSPASATTW